MRDKLGKEIKIGDKAYHNNDFGGKDFLGTVTKLGDNFLVGIKDSTNGETYYWSRESIETETPVFNVFNLENYIKYHIKVSFGIDAILELSNVIDFKIGKEVTSNRTEISYIILEDDNTHACHTLSGYPKNISIELE